ncbi:MAG: radical SAM protein [Planctomycetaceae bacterium]|nr:radical SAM protein [Planctomycetaceae bacterium]
MRLFRAWSSRHPVWCAWQVTYRCNFRCRFCGYWHDPAGLAPERPVSDYKAGSAKLARWGSLLVSLAGGEPLLRDDLPQIVRAVGRYHFPFVTTNGWLATPKVADDLMTAGLWGVSISIDYADAARHDKARSAPGAWEQAWRAVEMFSKARRHKWQRVNVIAVLMKDNVDDIAPLIEMAAKRNAYFMVQPYGHLKTGSRSHAHDNGPVSDYLVGLRKTSPNFLSNRWYLGQFDRFLHGGVPHCRAGRAFFNIDATGEVAICVERRHSPVGNLYSDHPEGIMERLRRASQDNACTECWYNCRGETESLYRPEALIASLPTLFNDRGAPVSPAPND